ncbi:MAG: TlpA disulfide reductase family protein [Saprospiraceae bacterium]|nr:TlpA disulfide reductase family protein [Saprospiraceae bacterium]
MFRLLIVLGLQLFVLGLLGAQERGYHIQVDLDGYQEEELYLAYYYGNSQYIRDTVSANEDGSFLFTGEEPLPPGMYLIVMAPDNQYVEVIVPENDQIFSLATSVQDPIADLKVIGSKENQLFYDYLNYLGTMRTHAGALEKQMTDLPDNADKTELQGKLEQIGEEVSAYQRRIMREFPESLTALLIRANLPMEYPEFSGTEEEKNTRRWRYANEHIFDNLDLADPRLLYTPFLFQRVDQFINKLTVQHPDSLIRAVDRVLDLARPAEENFRFLLIHFLNKYAGSKYVGMDAVYVHLAQEYYGKGLASWVEEEQLNKILENAEGLEKTLIGKIAPDITLQKRDGNTFALHDIDSKYTVLYFWKYDCGHCKESMPHMKEFYTQFKDRGVTLLAVCVKFTDDVPGCWEYVDENGLGDWLHAVDPYHRSNFSSKYYIKSTPQIFVLDRDKKIIMKRIGAEQLGEVMNKIMESDASGP